MPPSTFTDKTIQTLRSTVEAACADRRAGLPGAAVVVVDRSGNELFAHAAGRRGAASAEPMTLDSVFWLASCTKMVAGVACMQLVEQGVLRLDDGEQLEALCPELRVLKVLQADGTLADKQRSITLRMLLTHTAGFAYSVFNPRLRDWAYPVGMDEFSGRLEDLLTPLMFQPGEGWEYSTGIDWAGIALERATGLSLNDYMRQNIFEPLGIKDLSMFPTEDMKSRLAYMNARSPDGALYPKDHPFRMPLVAKGAEVSQVVNSGGAGLFGRPQEYCKILAVLLNEGTSPTTGAQLLKPATVATMFENQIGQFPDFARRFIPAAKPELTNPIPEIYPVPGNPPQGWGLTFMLSNGGPTGRSTRTGHWAGLPNLFWWCDPDKGVAGMVATQILPFCDANVLNLWGGVEIEVYAGLEAAKLAR